MRWPWVGRARLDAAQEEIRRLRAEWQELVVELAHERRRHDADRFSAAKFIARERDRYSALVAHVIELKKLDYGPPVVVPAPPVVPLRPIPPSVLANIARTSDPDTRERRAVEKRVRDLLASGVSETEVADMVLAGEDVDL